MVELAEELAQIVASCSFDSPCKECIAEAEQLPAAEWWTHNSKFAVVEAVLGVQSECR